MKVIRMAAVVAALVVSTSVVAEAQRGGGGGGRGQGRVMLTPEQQTDSLLKEITVTADVKKQVLAIVTKYQGERQQMMQAARGGGGDMQAMQTRAAELQTKQTEEIKKLLAAGQHEQFDKNVAAMAPQRRAPPPR